MRICKRKQATFRLGLGVAALVLTSVGGVAQAADAAPEPAADAKGMVTLQNVQVTAQKRLQSTQDVPMSMAVFSADELRERGVTSVGQLGNAAPGLQINDYGNPVITVITLRGVQQFDFGDHQESPVAVFVDGAYIPYLSAVGMNLFDLNRVEVLRGPQGTLFGRNATGGVIQLISARPTETFSGYGQVQLGNFGALRSEGAVSGPVGGGWLGRVSLLQDKHDGYYKNSLGTDKGDADNQSWRLQLARQVGEGGRLTFSARGSRDRTSTSPYAPAAAYPDAQTGLVTSGNAAEFASFCSSFFGTAVAPGAVDCVSGDTKKSSPYRISHNRIGAFARGYYGFNATVDYPLSKDLTLTSVTSYGKLRKTYEQEDSDGTSADVLYFGQEARATDVAQELRLAVTSTNFDVVMGLYALQIDGKYGGAVGFFPGDPALDARVENAYSLRTRTGALFAQSDFRFAPDWTLVTGLRRTEDRKRFRMSTPCTGVGCAALGMTDPSIVQGTGYDDSVAGAKTSRASGNWDGKLQLNWAPNADLLVYGGVSRGTKAGGYNAGATAFYPVDKVIFGDEALTSFELGFKRTFWQRRARLNVSVYDYQYKNIQVFNQEGISTLTFNRNGTARGMDADLQVRVAKGADVQLAVSLLKTRTDPVEYTNLSTGTVERASQELPNSPRWTVGAGLRKEWLIGDARWTLQGDAKRVSSRKLNLIDHPATREPAYSLIGMNGSYSPVGAKWELSVYCRNITDEQYRIVATPFVTTTGSVIQIYNEPRTFGASYRVAF